MIRKINIEAFLELAEKNPVLDVRSPGEYSHAHIPGAYNLPLFSDEERKVVGTLYKQQGRQQAIKTGLDYFGPKMSRMVEEAEAIIKAHQSVTVNLHDRQIPNPQFQIPKKILVHCWRGGMRSAGVAWLLDLYGFKVYTLIGGYRSFRNWTLQQFEKSYLLHIIGGYTGSGKTQVLHELAKTNHAVIDLEGIANHKGSAFGALGEAPQPTQEMFENTLATTLYSVSNTLPANTPIWLEDESRRIGLVNIPNALWETMQLSPVYFLDIPFEERLDHITEQYGKFKQEELVNAILRIQKRLGGLNAKSAINYLLETNYKEAFRILLRYYDKYYERGLQERNKINKKFTTISCTQVHATTNSNLLTTTKHQPNGVI